MYALAPAFRSVEYIDGLNFNYRKCCWVQYGNEEYDSLRTWISKNCEEFRDMQIARTALKDLNPCGIGYQRIVKNSVTCKLFDTPNMLEQ